MLKQALDNSRLKRQFIDETHNHKHYDNLSDRVNSLEEKLNLILQKLDSVEKGTDKMTSHIDFINDIYTRVQTPLFWICDRINYMRGYKMSLENPIVNNLSSIYDQD